VSCSVPLIVRAREVARSARCGIRHFEIVGELGEMLSAQHEYPGELAVARGGHDLRLLALTTGHVPSLDSITKVSVKRLTR
jgi:hypothetical protein